MPVPGAYMPQELRQSGEGDAEREEEYAHPRAESQHWEVHDQDDGAEEPQTRGEHEEGKSEDEVEVEKRRGKKKEEGFERLVQLVNGSSMKRRGGFRVWWILFVRFVVWIWA